MNRTQLRRSLVVRRTDLFFCLCLLSLGIVASERALAKSTPVIFDRPVVVTVTGYNPGTDQSHKVDFDIPVRSDNSFSLVGANYDYGTWMIDDLNVNGNVDPFTSLNYAVTNNDPVNTLLFTVSVTLPIAPTIPATVHGGSTTGSLTDGNLNGATVSTQGGLPFYQGQIDGATVLSFYPDPYSLSIPFGSGNVPAVFAGLPVPNLPSGPALSTIGIINRFTLTPGDHFAGNSFFIIEAVPEPSTLALVGLCLMVLTENRRRR